MNAPPHRAGVVLVRHGRTAGNAAGAIMGHRDLPLDEVGERQAAGLAVALAARAGRAERARGAGWSAGLGGVGGGPIDAVHSSPLRRARQTAAAVAAACGVPVVIDAELVELDFGRAATDASGGARPKLEVKTRHRYEPLPGGESLHDVWRRLEVLHHRLRPQIDAGRLVVLVGHYRANQLLEGLLRGRDFDAAVDAATYRPANGAAHLVTLDPPATTELWTPPVG